MIKSTKASHGSDVIELPLVPYKIYPFQILNAIRFPEEKKITFNRTETSEKGKKWEKNQKPILEIMVNYESEYFTIQVN